MDDQEISGGPVQNELAQGLPEKAGKPAKSKRVLNRRAAAVYRYYDRKERLLYVGISVSAITRMGGHKSKARWFRKVAYVTIHWHANRWDALEAEAVAVAREYPRYNVGHCLFSSAENRRRRELAAQGEWVRPPKH